MRTTPTLEDVLMPATGRRRRGLALAPLAAAAAALATLAAPGTATAAQAPAATAPAGRALLSVDAAQGDAALAYWTPERMAAARSAAPDDLTDIGTARTPAGAGVASAVRGAVPSAGSAPRTLDQQAAPTLRRGARTVSPTLTGAAVSTAAPWTAGGPVTAKVGRLYFRQGGAPLQCSASSVASRTGSVIATAGHCLTARGLPSTDVIFVPGMTPTREPYGRWAVRATFAPAQWARGDQEAASALNYDAGFAVVAPRRGKTLAQAVGTFGLTFGPALDRVTVFGYPADGDQKTLKHCTGQRFAAADGSSDQTTACEIAGGASGGPWLSDFDARTGTGRVTSVVSYAYPDDPGEAGRLYGPTLGDAVRAQFTRAEAVATR